MHIITLSVIIFLNLLKQFYTNVNGTSPEMSKV